MQKDLEIGAPRYNTVSPRIKNLGTPVYSPAGPLIKVTVRPPVQSDLALFDNMHIWQISSRTPQQVELPQPVENPPHLVEAPNWLDPTCVNQALIVRLI